VFEERVRRLEDKNSALKDLLDKKDEKINYFSPVDRELITSFVGLIIRVLRSTEIKESNY